MNFPFKTSYFSLIFCFLAPLEGELKPVVTYLETVQQPTRKRHQKVSLPAAADSHIKHVVFDLNGVLITTDKKKAFHEIGTYGLLDHFKKHRSLPGENDIINALHDLAYYAYATETPAMHKQKSLPLLLHDLQVGRSFDWKEIATLVSGYSFAIQQSIKMVFDPETFIKTRKLLKRGIAFVKELKAKGYTVHIISNWDAHSFFLIKDIPHLQELYELFDAQDSYIVLSGVCGYLKPQAEIFQLLLNQINADPATCLFLDDEEVNVAAARQVGMHSFVYKDNKPRAMHYQMCTLLLDA